MAGVEWAMVVCLLACLSLAPPIQVAPESIRLSADQPQLAVAADGRIGLVYATKNSLWITLGKDENLSGIQPITIPVTGTLAFGMRRGPRIAFSKKSVVVSAIVDGNLLAWSSADDGKTWTKPAQINSTDLSAREGLHAMASRSDGSVLAVWLDLRTKQTQVVASYSSNSGRSWGTNALVYASPEGSVCECCHPSIGYGPFGEVGVMFRNNIRGKRDMYLATSPDGGKGFARAVKIGAGSWELAACPMDGGALAYDEIGNPISVWRRENDLFLGKGIYESSLARGKNPWIAQMPRDHALVWESSNGQGVYFQYGDALATRARLAEVGSDPVVVATRRYAVCAWRSNGIYVQLIERR